MNIRPFLFVSLSLLANYVQGQNTIIVLNDSTNVKADIVSISEDRIFTKDDSFSLNKISYVRFLSSSQMQARPTLVEALLRKCITVYALAEKLTCKEGNEQLTTLPVSENEKDFSSPDDEISHGSFGLGIGVDYGGFVGGKLTLIPDRNVGFFLSAGVPYLLRLAFTGGVVVRFLPNKKITPTASLMYGYNASIIVFDAPYNNKTYVGPSIGFGLENRSRQNPKNGFHFNLIIPFRSDEFDKDWASLKSKSNIRVISQPLPVLISIGYHFGFKN